MFTLLALLWVVTPPQVGSIQIMVEPGAAVFLDGRQAGISSSAMGGFNIEEVPVGDHDVTIRTSYGGGVSKRVMVNQGQTTTITISSLGLRSRTRGDDATIEVQATIPGSTNCELAVGTEKAAGAAEDLRIERVRPGSQPVDVRCGDKRASGTIEVPPGKIVTVQADMATSRLKIINERARVTAVYVPRVEDAIMRLDLPFTWKRAVAASVVAGVKPKSVSRSGMVKLDITMTGPSYSAIEQFAERLKERNEVKTVYLKDWDYTSSSHRDSDGVKMSFIVTFENGQ
jgi:hypothetical protein